MPRPELRSFAGSDAATAAAAAFIADAARDAAAARGVFTLALSGGRTPARMLEALAAESVPWEQVHVFQVDERVAPSGDPARNLNMVETALLAPRLLPQSHLHAMPVEDADLDSAAARYGEALSDLAGGDAVLDLVHLGLGDDGHTASLVPGDPALDVTDRPVCITGDYRGHRRMTLTFPVLDRARSRLWLCTGGDKGPMLARLMAGDSGIPAGRVRGDDSAVFCDHAARDAASIDP